MTQKLYVKCLDKLNKACVVYTGDNEITISELLGIDITLIDIIREKSSEVDTVFEVNKFLTSNNKRTYEELHEKDMSLYSIITKDCLRGHLANFPDERLIIDIRTYLRHGIKWRLSVMTESGNISKNNALKYYGSFMTHLEVKVRGEEVIFGINNDIKEDVLRNRHFVVVVLDLLESITRKLIKGYEC